jgi:hypothetical protein
MKSGNRPIRQEKDVGDGESESEAFAHAGSLYLDVCPVPIVPLNTLLSGRRVIAQKRSLIDGRPSLKSIK